MKNEPNFLTQFKTLHGYIFPLIVAEETLYLSKVFPVSICRAYLDRNIFDKNLRDFLPYF